MRSVILIKQKKDEWGVGGSIKTIGLENKRKFNRIHYLQKKYEGLNDKRVYNKNQYKRFVNVVSSNYLMTRWQRKEAKHLIDQFNFNELFCSNYQRQAEWESIVTAICFYVMRKDNPKRPLPYNKRFVRSVSLTKHIYDRVSKKLKEKEESNVEVNTYYIVDKG